MARVRKLIVRDSVEALGHVKDGSTVLIGGFGESGTPGILIEALLETEARELVVVSNNAGDDGKGIDRLLAEGRVAKITCSFPKQRNGSFERLYRTKSVELELVPQGTLVERIRAGGAGLGGIFTPTAVGTQLAKVNDLGKTTRRWNGKLYLLEDPIRGDLSLIRAHVADRWGNVVYRKAARNFGPIMATASARTVVSVTEVLCDPLDPEVIVTPGIFVDVIFVRSSSVV